MLDARVVGTPSRSGETRWTSEIHVETQRRDVTAFRAELRRRVRVRVEQLEGQCPGESDDPTDPNDVSVGEQSWYALGGGLTESSTAAPLARARALASVAASAGAGSPMSTPDSRPWLCAAFARATAQLAEETGEVPDLSLGADPSLEAHAAAELVEARRVLERLWPRARASVDLHCDRVVWLRGERYHSMTMPYAFGVVFVRPRHDMTRPEYVEALLHESAHLELYVKQAFDPLVMNPLAPVRSPLRSDARPVMAALHAVYVLSRMIEGHERYLLGSTAAADRSTARLLLERHRESFRAGTHELAREAHFTAAGARLFATLLERREVTPCS
jgi:HEXXH motif-containing protein